MITIYFSDGEKEEVKNRKEARESILEAHAAGVEVDLVTDYGRDITYLVTWNIDIQEEK